METRSSPNDTRPPAVPGGTHGPRSRRRLALLIGCLLPAVGAAAAPSTRPQGRDAGPDPDPKARMPLEAILPAPVFPEPAPSETAPEDADRDARALRHLREGKKRFDEELWAEAIAEFESAVSIDPRLLEARILLARAGLQYGDDTRAEAQLREVLKHRPRDLAAHQLLGEIAWRRKRPDEAIAEFRLALRAGAEEPRRPEVVLARISLAQALHEAGYLSAAAEQLEAFLAAVDEMGGEPPAHPELRQAVARFGGEAAARLGDIRTNLGDHARAAAAYRRALADQPEDASLRRRLAFALARGGNVEEALACARRWLLALPKPAGELNALEEICRLLGRPQRYEAELVRLAETATDATLRTTLVGLLLDRGRRSEARALLERQRAKGMAAPEEAYLLARLYGAEGEAEKAYRVIIDTLRAAPETESRAMRLLEGREADIKTTDFIEPAERLAAERPDDAVARFGLGFLLLLQHRDARALAELRAASNLDKSLGAPRAAVARLLVRQKRWREAIDTADTAIEAGVRSAGLYLNKALAHDALSEYEEAEAAFLESFALDRRSPEPLFRLALSVDRRGQALRCEELYRRILDDVDPRFMPAREKLVIWYLNRGKLDDCREYFSDFERLGQSGPIVERCRAMLALTTSKARTPAARLEEYVTALRDILEEYPDDAATCLELARSYNTVHRYEEALEQVEASLRLDPTSLRARELKASLLMKRLEFEPAERVIRSLLEDRPHDGEYLQLLLDVAYNRADYDAAVDLLRKLLDGEARRKRRGPIVSQLIATLNTARRFDEAVETARSWLDESPEDRSRRRLYLSTLAAAGRHEQAVALAERYLKEDPTDRGLQIQLLLQLERAGRTLEAEQRALAWLADAPDDIDLNAVLIRLCWDAKQWDDAIDLARTGAELPEHRARYQDWLGRSYLFARRFDEAIDFYRERANDLQTESAYGSLLAVLIAAERYAEAERVTNKVLRPHLAAREAGRLHDPALIVRMRNILVEIYQNTGRQAQAFQQLEAIYKMAPDDPAINNNLGYTWADAGLNLDRAEKMIRFALSEDPRSAANLDSLGWVLYKQGRLEEAVPYLRRSLRMPDGEDPVILDHLADALYRLGRSDEARRHWRKALGLCDPASDPPPDRERRRLRGVIEAKLHALDAGETVKTADVAGPLATSQPASLPAP